jgi:hypothetical protein
MAMKQINDIIYSAVSTLLRPLVRILLRNNIPLATFAELAKRTYVEVAMEDFHLPNRKQSVSRVALLTGLSRKEVLRVTRLAPAIDSVLAEQHNRSTRVVSGWVRDERFHRDGATADLSFDGDALSFAELVKQYSGDITPRAVLDELLRGGLVQRLEDGRLHLAAPGYLPQSEAEKLHILGSETADLIGTIDHNLQKDQQTPYFQRKVCYTRFPAQHLEGLRNLSREKAQRLLEELDRWMASHDQEDPEPDDDRQHRRVGLSIYYFESELQEGDHHEDHQENER